jgi:hypothetical protein
VNGSIFPDLPEEGGFEVKDGFETRPYRIIRSQQINPFANIFS